MACVTNGPSGLLRKRGFSLLFVFVDEKRDVLVLFCCCDLEEERKGARRRCWRIGRDKAQHCWRSRNRTDLRRWRGGFGGLQFGLLPFFYFFYFGMDFAEREVGIMNGRWSGTDIGVWTLGWCRMGLIGEGGLDLVIGRVLGWQ